tara:strand:+ start:34493 stop:35578 length:1086 start_codon:yes stop_codon:yes gene_type:complete
MNFKIKKIYAVIMAGGQGTRFWPLSRKKRPKQLLNIIGDQSMLQITVDRLRKIDLIEDIFIVTNPELASQIKKEIKGINNDNIIIEPYGKNTTPSIALAAIKIKSIDKNAIIGIFPSDHFIIGHKAFLNSLKIASELASDKNLLVTMGIVPKFPHTGYGYIQYDKKISHNKISFNVKTFAEKPLESAAIRFIKSGDFLWNSGMFIWKAKTFLNSMKELIPDQYEIIKDISKKINTPEYKDILYEKWENLKPESVDYSILEKAKNICVIKSDFTWSDLGSWNTFFEFLSKDKNENIIKGNGLILKGSNNLIHSNDKFTAVVGIENSIIVNTDDALLVINRSYIDEIKNLLNEIKLYGKEELL